MSTFIKFTHPDQLREVADYLGFLAEHRPTQNQSGAELEYVVYNPNYNDVDSFFKDCVMVEVRRTLRADPTKNRSHDSHRTADQCLFAPNGDRLHLR